MFIRKTLYVAWGAAEEFQLQTDAFTLKCLLPQLAAAGGPVL